MDDTPTKLEALAVDIKAVLHIFDVLESFKYRVSTDVAIITFEAERGPTLFQAARSCVHRV